MQGTYVLSQVHTYLASEVHLLSVLFSALYMRYREGVLTIQAYLILSKQT